MAVLENSISIMTNQIFSLKVIELSKPNVLHVDWVSSQAIQNHERGRTVNQVSSRTYWSIRMDYYK